MFIDHRVVNTVILMRMPDTNLSIHVLDRLFSAFSPVTVVTITVLSCTHVTRTLSKITPDDGIALKSELDVMIIA